MSGRVPEPDSMLELFRVEVENQTQVLTAGLLALESDPRDAAQLEQCMRAAHSLKGAARIVGVGAGVSVAHAMEDCFAAAQQGRAVLQQRCIDLLLQGVDWLTRIGQTPEGELAAWSSARAAELEIYTAALQRELEAPGAAGADPEPARAVPAGKMDAAAEPRERTAPDRALRLTAENLNRLLGLAGEARVESRWLEPFGDSLLRLKRAQDAATKALEAVGLALPAALRDERLETALARARERAEECRQQLCERIEELDGFTRRAHDLSRRLYAEALASRVRPFADAVGAFPRMVRDLGRSLGKSVRLEVRGQATPVDRDVLELLDAPLTHLLRNAVDHGIDSPDERRAAGKPAEARIRLDARHGAGLLQIGVEDDGRGVALDGLRRRIVARQLTSAETAARLTEAELLEFLFLPGFTLKDRVDEISGRGVGLDVVQHAVKQVRGSIRVHTAAGIGTCFQLQLPLTLSVVRALLVEIAGEPYAFPLAHVASTLKLAPESIQQLEGRQHFRWGGRAVGLITAHQIFRAAKPQLAGSLAVVVIGDAEHLYGLIVDRVLGERELVVQRLDGRLGKIKDVVAGALLEDGSPALIADVEDLIRSADKLSADGALDRAGCSQGGGEARRRKRVLVVDDSFTVREVERKLLGHRGYDVEVAVDGMDGWNAVRVGDFDLVITDVDMPRLDGIELVALIRADPQLQALPVLIVSYKDREEDRLRGLEAGADYYLTKGSFHDERLLDAVADLIGGADA